MHDITQISTVNMSAFHPVVQLVTTLTIDIIQISTVIYVSLSHCSATSYYLDNYPFCPILQQQVLVDNRLLPEVIWAQSWLSCPMQVNQSPSLVGISTVLLAIVGTKPFVIPYTSQPKPITGRDFNRSTSHCPEYEFALGTSPHPLSGTHAIWSCILEHEPNNHPPTPSQRSLY